MTLALVAIAAMICLTTAAFVGDVAASSATAAQAQLAADAAALASAAESAPYGRGLPEYEARRAAEANGARLVDCMCERGATATQVKVELDDVVAEARAVIDPTRFGPAGVSFDGMHPSLTQAIDRLLGAAKGSVWVVSGFRSPTRQAELWSDAVARYGSPEAADDWVARPGYSMHERGLAVDLGGDVARAAELTRRLGLPLHRPLPHEPWHFELVGSRS